MFAPLRDLARRSAAAAVLLLSTLAAAGAQQAPASSTGRITGRILDANTGVGIATVGVQVVGTTLGTTSGVDGRFTIPNVPAGTVTLQARRIGYQPKTVTGILLDAGAGVQQDIVLAPATVELEAVTVSAAAERGTVNEALDHQRTATGIVNAVTAEQIQTSPDGDAAQAVQRVSGVTVQDGRYVVVRGLGERYTTTSLNGARLPSPEPEKRVVPLDLFPSGLLQTITTAKTFTPDLPGDFSGAQVDIRTREFPLRRTVSYSATVGYNGRATGRDVVGAPTVGTEWLGVAGSARALPGVVAAAGDLGGLDQAATNAVVGAFRNAWTPVVGTGSANYSMSASVGGEDPVLFGRRLGYLASATYSYNQEIQADEIRSQAQPDATGRIVPLDRFDGETGRTSVLWGGLLNLTAFLSPTSRLSLNNTFSRSADNEAHLDVGHNEEFGLELRRSELRFVERTIRSNQLRGEHHLGGRHEVAWHVTSAAVSRDEPDRALLVYAREVGTSAPFGWASFLQQGTARSFGELDESALSGGTDWRMTFGDPARQWALKAGASWRRTAREASERPYVLRGSGLSDLERQQSAEQIFGGYVDATDSVFAAQLGTLGGRYEADETITAAYGMTEIPAGERVRVIVGGRAERWDLAVDTEGNQAQLVRSERSEVDVLPAAVVNVKLGEHQNLRLSASRTLSRPELREVSSACYVVAFGSPTTCGNPLLERALVQNYDARWEWYPNPGEVLSLGVFAKRFDDPIERTELLSTGRPQYGFVNADGADTHGVELEVRTGLGGIVERLEPLTAFANATIMRSEIRLGDDEATAGLTSQRRPMVGQAPYVVNAGLVYASPEGRLSATLLVNRIGERVYSAGVAPLTDASERPRTLLDLSLQFPLMDEVAAKLDARNLLDSPVEVGQGDVVRSRYSTGRVVSLGLSWRPGA